jgi:uncharacterized membrane-anchored protein
MASGLTAVAAFAVFLLLYAALGRRQPDGSRRPVHWGWLAAIGSCAAVAMLAGLLTR